MDFYPHSEITIGTYSFSGVNEVVVKRSMKTLSDTATIKLPGRSYIRKGKRNEDGTVTVMPERTENKNTGKLFGHGDKVTIKLGWNGELHEEFVGFVRRVGRGIPVEVECEGYVAQLRDKVSVSGVLKTTNVKQLLAIATGQVDLKDKILAKPLTDITYVCNIDVTLKEVELKTLNGLQICDLIKSMTDNTVQMYFIKPDVLWCGLPFTSYAGGKDPMESGTVGYRPGWNAILDKELKQRMPEAATQVTYGGKYATGGKQWGDSKKTDAPKKEKKVLNNVADKATLEKLGAEKEYRANYKGYEGKLTAFLQPFCQPGYKATIINALYPELDGDYLVEETEVKFGMSGARRTIVPGPVVGFGK